MTMTDIRKYWKKVFIDSNLPDSLSRLTVKHIIEMPMVICSNLLSLSER